MRQKTGSIKRWLVIGVVMLFSVVALNLPNSASARPQADFCEQCATDCLNEAWWAMQQCWQNGGTSDTCSHQYDQTLNNCNAVFCNYGGGCDLPTNYPIRPKPRILP
jgi:hypothetical protein